MKKKPTTKNKQQRIKEKPEKKQTCRDGGKMALEKVRAIETFGGSFEIVRKEIL